METEKLLPQAPHEQGVAVTAEWNLMVTAEDRTVSGSLDTILSAVMVGCGRVELVKVELKYIATESGATLYAGFQEAGGSKTAKQVAMKPSGHAHVANTLNFGQTHEVTLVPEGILSRQIRPNSSDLPMIKFELNAGTKMEVAVHYYLNVIGPRLLSLK